MGSSNERAGMAGNRVLVASSQTALKLQLALKKLQLPQTRTYREGTRQMPAGLTPMMVKCVKDGGSAGDSSVDCSWTFEISDYRTGEVLGTGKSRGNGWIPKTKYQTPNALGVVGLAYRDVDGVWKLWDVACQPETEECP